MGGGAPICPFPRYQVGIVNIATKLSRNLWSLISHIVAKIFESLWYVHHKWRQSEVMFRHFLSKSFAGSAMMPIGDVEKNCFRKIETNELQNCYLGFLHCLVQSPKRKEKSLNASKFSKINIWYRPSIPPSTYQIQVASLHINPLLAGAWRRTSRAGCVWTPSSNSAPGPCMETR